jgi:hypothetical protein
MSNGQQYSVFKPFVCVKGVATCLCLLSLLMQFDVQDSLGMFNNSGYGYDVIGTLTFLGLVMGEMMYIPIAGAMLFVLLAPFIQFSKSSAQCDWRVWMLIVGGLSLLSIPIIVSAAKEIRVGLWLWSVSLTVSVLGAVSERLFIGARTTGSKTTGSKMSPPTKPNPSNDSKGRTA